MTINLATIKKDGKDFRISRQLLIEVIGSENTIESAVKRKQIKKVGHGWYSYNSLSAEWQTKVLSYLNLSTKQELLELLNGHLNEAKAEVKDDAKSKLPELWASFIDTRDEHYYRAKLADSTVKNIGEKIKDMGRGMAIFRMLDTWKTKTLIREFTGLETREELMKSLCEVIQQPDTKVECLPTSYQRFRTKFYEFAKSQPLTRSEKDRCQGIDPRDVLISGRFGNDNTLKFTDEQKAIVLELYLKANKPDAFVCYQDYLHLMKSPTLALPKGEGTKQVVSYSTVKAYVGSNEVVELVNKCRHGSSYYETTVRPMMLMKRAEYPYSLVCGDGINIGRRVKHTRLVKDKQSGKMVEVEVIGLMSVWVWWDHCTGAVLGYDISPTEDQIQIRRSFRHIINLNNGICPASVMMDKKWLENPENEVLFAKLGVKMQNKRAYAPWQNMAEGSNKRLNHEHRLLDELWINRTPGASQDNSHNEDLKQGSKFLEEHEFRSMVADLLNILNHIPRKVHNGKTSWEVLKEKQVSPWAKNIDVLERIWVFGTTTILTVNAGKFAFKIGTKTFNYVLPDWEAFRERNIKYNRVRVYYDENHLDEVHIYAFEDEEKKENDRFLYACKQLKRVSGAEIERTEVDNKLFGEEMARKKATDRTIKEKTDKRHKVLEDMGLDLVTIKGTTQERYKEFHQNTEANVMKQYMEYDDRKRGHKVSVDSRQATVISDREKFDMYKDVSFEEE
jgi:hypothetical protein